MGQKVFLLAVLFQGNLGSEKQNKEPFSSVQSLSRVRLFATP